MAQHNLEPGTRPGGNAPASPTGTLVASAAPWLDQLLALVGSGLIEEIEILQHGQALILRFPDGQVLVIPDFFAEADPLTLPEGLTSSGETVTVVNASQFNSLLDANDIDLDPLLARVEPASDSQLASLVQASESSVDGQPDTGQTTDEAPVSEGPAPGEAEEDLLLALADELIPEDTPAEESFDLGGSLSGSDGTTGTGGAAGSTATVGSNPQNIGTLSALGGGLLGGGGDAIGGVSGNLGSLVSRATVDGLNGIGGTSGVGGNLGTADGATSPGDALGTAAGAGDALGSPQSTTLNALPPPSDAFAGFASAPVAPSQKIEFNGTFDTSVEGLNDQILFAPDNDELLGGGAFSDDSVVTDGIWTTLVNFYAVSGDDPAGSTDYDQIVFSDSEVWTHYYVEGRYFNTSSDKDVLISGYSFPQYSSVLFDIDPISQISQANTFSITIDGVNGGAAVVVDVSTATDGDSLAALINADATLAAAGVQAVFNIDYFTSPDAGLLRIVDTANRTISAATLTKDNGSDLDTSGPTFETLTLGDIDKITFKIDGVEYTDGDPSARIHFFSPDYREPSQIAVNTNTNITRYHITGTDWVDEHYALTGANDDNFVFIDTGEYDIDTLSFFYYDWSDPTQVGDGDYDLVTQGAYDKIRNIEILDARDYVDSFGVAQTYGVNNIVLSKDAVATSAEEMKLLEDADGDGVYTLTPTNQFTISVAGDFEDSVALTDASEWTYNGWVNEPGKIIPIIDIQTLEQTTDTPDTKVIPSTIDQYGNILYQFTATGASGEELYVNVSADFGVHPDWYYTGTAGDDVFELPDTQFGLVDFGAGEDTLEMDSGPRLFPVGQTSNLHDFTGEGGDLANVEIITYRGSIGDYDITIDRLAVAGVTDADNVLTILGDDSGDTLTLSDVATDWTYLGTVAGGGGLTGFDFAQYQYRPGTVDQVVLNVHDALAGAIPVYYRGWEDDDLLNVFSMTFDGIDGGAGTDAIRVDAAAQDFTGLESKIANIEVIDGAGHTAGTTSITVDLAFVSGATGVDGGTGRNTLTLLGDAGVDEAILTDTTNWSWVGQTTGFGTTLYQYRSTDGATLAAGSADLSIQADLATTPGIFFNGTAGDDVFSAPDQGFLNLDGGAGTDSLVLLDGDYALDGLESKVANLEVIDAGLSAGADAVTLGQAFVTGASDAGNTLTILGEAGVDNVALTDETAWSWAGQVTAFGGMDFYQYKSTDGTATLNVQADLASTPGIFFNGTVADDYFTAPDLGFAYLQGGDGTDWLAVSSDDYDFTAAGVAAKIDDLEVVDARGDADPNRVTLDLASLQLMTNDVNKLTVMGDGVDSVALDDIATNWSWIGYVEGIEDFTGLFFYQYQSLDGTSVLNVWETIADRPEVYAIGDIGGVERDDVLLLEGLDFVKVDGRLGTDTLQVDAAISLDLTALGDRVDNMEVIDLAGASTGVRLSADFVFAASDADNWLVVQGDVGDGITLADASSWSYAGFVEASGDWSTLHGYVGTTTGGESVLLYHDTLLGGPLVDALGSAGDDLLYVAEKEDTNIHLGTGFDTLQLRAGTGPRTIDFTSGTDVSGVELLSMDNGSQETARFDLSAVDAADGNAIYVRGDAGLDAVETAESWGLIGRAQFSDAPDMYAYQTSSGGVTGRLYVQTDLVQTLYSDPVGTAGDDLLRTIDLDFGSLDGGAGFDRLNFLQEGALDLTQAGIGDALTGIEALDMTNGVANTLELDAASVLGMNATRELYVLGDTGDRLQLDAGTTWRQGSTYQVSDSLSLESYTSTSGGELVAVYVDTRVDTSVA